MLDIIFQNSNNKDLKEQEVNELHSDEFKTELKHFKCTYEGCQSVFNKKIRLQAHIRVNHTGYMPFFCSVMGCKASFACKTYLNKHLKRHNNEFELSKRKRKSEFKCPECLITDLSKIFKTKLQLKCHLAEQHGHLSFSCDKCDKKFMYRSKLLAHQHRHRGYKCSFDDCNFQTDKWTLLRKHFAQEHKKLKCDICLKQYSSSYNLRIHKELVHSKNNQEMFKCTFEGCDKVYSRSTSLNNHIRTFHCEPKHCCSVCNNKYRHKKSLVKHLSQCSGKNKLNRKEDQTKKLKKEKILNKLPKMKPFIDKHSFDQLDQEILEYCENESEQPKNNVVEHQTTI